MSTSMCDCSKNNSFHLKHFQLPCHEINIEILLRKQKNDYIYNRGVREFCVILNERKTDFKIHLDLEMFHQLITSLREWNTVDIDWTDIDLYFQEIEL